MGAITAHGIADPDQFIMSHLSGYLWREGIPYPQFDRLLRKWEAADSISERRRISFRMQELYNRQPTTIALYYPEELYVFNRQSFDGWVEARGYGMVHKWSFLDPQVRRNLVVPTSTQ
jgi:peptide/nickel transport system substrate-binding protein